MRDTRVRFQLLDLFLGHLSSIPTFGVGLFLGHLSSIPTLDMDLFLGHPSSIPTLGVDLFLVHMSSIPTFGVDLFLGRVILPCQAPGVTGSALGLLGLVSVYCDWVR